MDNLDQSPAFIRAKNLITQAFEIAGFDGDRDALSDTYAKAVFISAMKDLISRLPQDVQEKATLTLTTAPTEAAVVELGQYMTPEQRSEIFNDNMRSTFRMYIDDNKSGFTDDQVSKLEALYTAIA